MRSVIIGIDEVGRGCLAGPVMVGAVCLASNYPDLTFSYLEKHSKNVSVYKSFEEFMFVKDSKQLTQKNREKVAGLVEEKSLKNVVLSASNELIDKFGIGVCLSHLFLIAVQILAKKAVETRVIIDGQIKLLPDLDPDLTDQIIKENGIPKQIDLDFYKEYLDSGSLFGQKREEIQFIKENKADDKYLSVALASNIAKVRRDKLMIELDKDYPEYGWKTNVGYGSQSHRNAIKQNSHNPYFRKTWLKKILK